MDTIFTNSGNSLLLNLSDKINLKRSDKYVSLSNLSILYMRKHKKLKINYNYNDKFELPDRSYSVSVVQDYFEYIIKNHETLTENPQVRRIHVNKIENRITFKIKTRHYLELLMSETMKLLGSSKK